MDDLDIIELFNKRDEKAILEAERKYRSYCHAISNNILRDRESVEECLNDTWLNAWNSIPPQVPDNLRMYLAKIIRNLSFNRYKSAMAVKRGGGKISAILDELEECLAGPSDVESDLIIKELGESINQFVHTLSERDCNVFVRRYFYAESIKEISVNYGITENNVMVSLSRTRKRLRKHLQKEDYKL
ncbi:RNA polymerase sigma factor [Youngiibacter multivorans]|uniref:RNA polymerase sigma-70 factor (ECF subfamily) n=1 Tax=Youngiibacter multivorans TaxID=937251 RepID=A0ABS4G8K8_9CLOT|nr:sigma-70 family RNA polymerase sigma factor [Youngiibacter multivorans]MBP1920762.1 RNA polymerase sigma-70 factor (ECF subfamily) [Youngiibacter multivorans]